MRCKDMADWSLHANYGIRRVKHTFYMEVFLLIGPTWSICIVCTHRGDNAYFMRGEQHYQRSRKGRGVPQREILPFCAKNLRFGPKFHNQVTKPHQQKINFSKYLNALLFFFFFFEVQTLSICSTLKWSAETSDSHSWGCKLLSWFIWEFLPGLCCKLKLLMAQEESREPAESRVSKLWDPTVVAKHLTFTFSKPKPTKQNHPKSNQPNTGN